MILKLLRRFMTLFSIDKNSDDRLSPTPNAADVHADPMAHATASISPRASGTQTVAKVTTKNSQIIANDGSNNIGLFGFDDAGKMVVKVAKTGFDANNATNDQLVFNSSQNVFKIVAKIPITLTYSHTNPASEYHTTALPHGLTYTPNYTASHTIDPGMITFWGLTPVVGSRPNPSSLVGATAGKVFSLCYAEVTVDATNIYLMVQTGGNEPTGSYTFSATAYLEQETLN
jgi:hypothetical protein